MKINLNINSYNSELINAVEYFYTNHGIKFPAFINANKKLSNEIKNTLINVGYIEEEVLETLLEWKKLNYKLKKQYNLAYGKHIENIIYYLLKTNNINVDFSNGSNLCYISNDVNDFKKFDIIINSSYIESSFVVLNNIGIDIKNGTIWNKISSNLKEVSDKWIYNTGFTKQKVLELKSFNADNRYFAFLVPELETDIKNKIFFVNIDDLIDNNNIKIDNNLCAHHPFQDDENFKDKLLLNINECIKFEKFLEII